MSQNACRCAAALVYYGKAVASYGFCQNILGKTQYKYPNLIIRLTADYKSKEQFEVVPIPINRGIVGYRVFLVRKEMQPDFKEVYSLSDIQVKRLKAGQGRWTDVDILRDNGINVIVGMSYEGLFGMLMEKRFDFFPRGINEAFEEFETRKERYPEMQVEETLALHYPLPRVLVTNKGNTAVAERIERGLKAIIADGTHRKIWKKYNQKWIEKSKLENRKIIYLKNPYALPNLPYDQDGYWYQPGETFQP